MPNYFALIRKTDPKREHASLVKVDEEMCAHFGVAPHPKLWHAYWHDIIGFSLACGKTFAQLIERNEEQARRDRANGDEDGAKFNDHQVEILRWLDANFDADAWARIGK